MLTQLQVAMESGTPGASGMLPSPFLEVSSLLCTDLHAPLGVHACER